MRDQYAGDVTDYLKFSLLRSVVAPAAKLGIAWYYLPADDGRPDGRHIEYQNELIWRDLDPPLLDELATLKDKRSVVELQRLRIWRSETFFYGEPVPVNSKRESWSHRMAQYLNQCDIVFADPDNGLSQDGIVSSKSANIDEIELLTDGLRPVILIRFPSRSGRHVEQLKLHHKRLARHSPLTIRTCVQVRNRSGNVSPRIRWFTLLNASKEIIRSAQQFVDRLKIIPGAKATMLEDGLW